MTRVPAVMSTLPMSILRLNSSCRKTKARIRVMTTLILSMGTTLDTLPSWMAR